MSRVTLCPCLSIFPAILAATATAVVSVNRSDTLICLSLKIASNRPLNPLTSTTFLVSRSGSTTISKSLQNSTVLRFITMILHPSDDLAAVLPFMAVLAR